VLAGEREEGKRARVKNETRCSLSFSKKGRLGGFQARRAKGKRSRGGKILRRGKSMSEGLKKSGKRGSAATTLSLS